MKRPGFPFALFFQLFLAKMKIHSVSLNGGFHEKDG
jgi:hypothetical protein